VWRPPRRGWAASQRPARPGAQSEGTYDHNQSVQSGAREVLAAIGELKRRNVAGSDHIGLWGISRAGWICPLVIEKVPSVAFWISVSGTDDKETRLPLEANPGSRSCG
jgi:hypothetical protein